MNICSENKPAIGHEVIFTYDGVYHIGYLINDWGSDNPRKWQWFSYIKGYDVIEDLVEFWWELP